MASSQSSVRSVARCTATTSAVSATPQANKIYPHLGSSQMKLGPKTRRRRGRTRNSHRPSGGLTITLKRMKMTEAKMAEKTSSVDRAMRNTTREMSTMTVYLLHRAKIRRIQTRLKHWLRRFSSSGPLSQASSPWLESHRAIVA